ncbi:MAG: helix-turn-helix domain-containing protein [Chloroflexi bacterium]|nr:helix-turn-helix domain-containing protein [Chloroflexota bacterium]
MRETIVMTGRDQQRALIVTEFVAGALTISEAATVLGLSERQVWRLRTRFLRATRANCCRWMKSPTMSHPAAPRKAPMNAVRRRSASIASRV